MVLVGLDQRYIVANQKFADMTGYARAELQGMAISIIGYADDVAMGMAQRQQLLDGSIDSVTAERRFKRKDGSVF
jgi:PAS domain S-box-containing protein